MSSAIAVNSSWQPRSSEDDEIVSGDYQQVARALRSMWAARLREPHHKQAMDGRVEVSFPARSHGGEKRR
ncbi:MAG TPA: hypothetical protein VFP88_08315 [Rhodanobacteraceae bacterium]|nr:hypothetical protein [Rhodanobacteraceae bacterium]